MTCIHGLDEVNCPTCRIIRSSLPLKAISPKETNVLDVDRFISKKKLNLEKKLIDEITPKKIYAHPPNFVLKPKLINEIPNFKDRLFNERFENLDISKEDNYGITKKIPLENPEWEFEEED